MDALVSRGAPTGDSPTSASETQAPSTTGQEPAGSDAHVTGTQSGDGVQATAETASGNAPDTADSGNTSKGNDEKPAPFHQHPRWMQMQERTKQAEQAAKSFEQSNQALQTQLTQLQQQITALQPPQQTKTQPVNLQAEMQNLLTAKNSGELNDAEYQAKLFEVVQRSNEQMTSGLTKDMQSQLAELKAQWEESQTQQQADQMVRQFRAAHPDFEDVTTSDTAQAVLEKNPLLSPNDSMAIYYAAKVQGAEDAKKAHGEAEYQRGLKEGAENARKDKHYQQSARSTGPGTPPVPAAANARLADTSKHGGLKTALVKEFGGLFQ